MKKCRTSEGRQSNTLQDLGLAHDVPVADCSDQPDSGSRIGGLRGVDEFGIEGGAAEEWSIEAADFLLPGAELVEPTQAAVESVEDFSEEGEIEEEVGDEFEDEFEAEAAGEAESEAIAQVLQQDGQEELGVDSLPDDLKALIELRLGRHDRIDASHLSVSVQSEGLVVIRGRVRSQSESLRVSEVVSALPGVHAIRNHLVVPR